MRFVAVRNRSLQSDFAAVSDETSWPSRQTDSIDGPRTPPRCDRAPLPSHREGFQEGQFRDAHVHSRPWASQGTAQLRFGKLA